MEKGNVQQLLLSPSDDTFYSFLPSPGPVEEATTLKLNTYEEDIIESIQSLENEKKDPRRTSANLSAIEEDLQKRRKSLADIEIELSKRGLKPKADDMLTKSTALKRVSFAANEDAATVSTASLTADFTTSFGDLSVMSDCDNISAPPIEISQAKKTTGWDDFDMEAWCEEFSKETYETVKKTHAIAENHFAIGKETNITVNRCEDMLRLLVEQKKTQKSTTKVEQTASTSTYRNKKGLSASSSSNANRKKLTIPQGGPACMKKKQERHKTKADVKEELRNFRF